MKTYYKDETAKAIENFKITSVPVNLKLVYAIAEVKKAASHANYSIGRLDKSRSKAIDKAVDRILAGEFDSQFVTDQIQGGAGTSMHMNVNEVISSIAEEDLKNKIEVHPIDHVNMGQSTNDVIPTAIKIMTLRQVDELVTTMKLVVKTLRKKSAEFKDIVKVGRTHLQDAVPITLGQSFGAYASFFERNIKRLEENKKYLYSTNLGGTAIGSGINSSKYFIKIVNNELKIITGYSFKPATDLFDETQNSDNFLHYANLIKTFAAGLSKICNDLRILSSGPTAGLGELIIPEVQKGSSIMPGKVNPVILEMTNQICYQVFGNVEVAFHVALNSQLELNVMLPVYIKNISEAFTILINGLKTLNSKVLINIKPDKTKIKELFDNSLCVATALNRYIGYDKTAELVKRAIKNNSRLIDELEKEKLLSKSQIEKILDPKELTEPTDQFLEIK